MREYLLSVAAVSVVCAACTLISYKGVNDKGTKIALSILLLYSAATPAIAFVSGFSDLTLDAPETELPDASLEDSLYYTAARDAYAEGISRFVCDEFSLESACVAVQVYGFDLQRMRSEKIKIFLSGRAISADTRRIKAAVEGLQLGECEVELEIS